MIGLPLDPLHPSHRPTAVTLEIPAVDQIATAAEYELTKRALDDRCRCCGYFPALAGAAGILAGLPACQEFAARLPRICCRGAVYRFNFLRLSLVQQSNERAYQLDSDADTAITGDLVTLRQGRIRRLFLNLSTRTERNLHYLDVNSWSVELAAEGSYLRPARPAALRVYARVFAIPSRRGSTVHGVAFPSNVVLHSGLDDHHGHFVAAYGTDADASVVVA